jgi:hypothetical protein
MGQDFGIDLADVRIVIHDENAMSRFRAAMQSRDGWLSGWQQDSSIHIPYNKLETIAGAIRCYPQSPNPRRLVTAS